MRNLLLGFALGVLIVIGGILVVRSSSEVTGNAAVGNTEARAKAAQPVRGEPAEDESTRKSHELVARTIAEEKAKDETAKIKADWEKDHNNRPNFISMIYLERVTDIEVLRQKILPLDHNFTDADRKQVDEALAA